MNPNNESSPRKHSVFRRPLLFVGVLLAIIGWRLTLAIFLNLAAYAAWWILFIALVFSATRFTSSPKLFVRIARIILALIIYYIEFRWLVTEMRNPDYKGLPDFDFIFLIGVFVRVVLVCFILKPVATLRLRIAAKPSSIS
ncbi:MAG: hypothetical protein WCK17_17630 [Verrucomicrobiota bacterium]